jgi:MFS transporter, DHA1 family, multidrug resistance protein
VLSQVEGGGENLMDRPGLRMIFLLSLLISFASISTNLYLPAMPLMAVTLGVDDSSLALTISGFLIGFSLGQLVWGPFSDRYGRKRPIAVGLLLFIVGATGCALSMDVVTMIGFRVIQGIGACASVVLARAIVRDIYAGSHAARMMSTLMTVMTVAPLLGPSIGSAIVDVYSWRAIFWLLTGIGLLTLLLLRALPETLPQASRNRRNALQAYSTYMKLLRHRRLLGYAGVVGCFYGGLYAYIAGTPLVYIAHYHVLPGEYGTLFAVNVLGIVITNQINSRLAMFVDCDRIILAGVAVAAMAGVALCFITCTGAGGLVGVVIALFVFVSMSGFIVANSIAGALNTFSSDTGAVSALVGCIQYGTGILGSALISTLSSGSPSSMGIVIALMSVGSVVAALALVR